MPRSGFQPNQRGLPAGHAVAPMREIPIRCRHRCIGRRRRCGPHPGPSRRRRASALKSAMNRPRAFGTKAASAPESPFSSASRTSAPTSKCPGPMAGPSHAMSLSGGNLQAPAPWPRSPRRPAPASPHAPPRPGPPNLPPTAMGKQSAVRIAHTRPRLPRERPHPAGAATSAAWSIDWSASHRRPDRPHRPMHLRQPRGLRRQPSRRLQAPPILGHRLRPNPPRGRPS